MSSYQGYGFRGVDGGDLTADPHPLCPQEHATPARAEVCGLAHTRAAVHIVGEDRRWGIAIDEMYHTLTMDRLRLALWGGG